MYCFASENLDARVRQPPVCDLINCLIGAAMVQARVLVCEQLPIFEIILCMYYVLVHVHVTIQVLLVLQIDAYMHTHP